MKCVILAGGAATRLNTMLSGINKHLLPIGNKSSVIRISLQQLISSGINEFLIITNPDSKDVFIEITKSFSRKYIVDFNIICSANVKLPLLDVIYMARDFVGNSQFILYLGDNLFLPMYKAISFLKLINYNPLPNIVVLGNSPDMLQFGVCELSENMGMYFIEKPTLNELSVLKKPRVLMGLAKYSSTIFNSIKEIRENNNLYGNLSDLNNLLNRKLQLKFLLWDRLWFDIGTPQRYLAANAVYSALPQDIYPLLNAGIERSILNTNNYLKSNLLSSIKDFQYGNG